MSQINVPLEKVLDTVDGVIGINRESNIIYWSPGASQLFGYSELDMIGKSLNTILDSDTASYHIPKVKNYSRDPRPQRMSKREQGVFTGRGAMGREVPVQISLLPVTSPNGDQWIFGLMNEVQPQAVAAAKDQTAAQMMVEYFKTSSALKQLMIGGILLLLIASFIGLAIAILIAG